MIVKLNLYDSVLNKELNSPAGMVGRYMYRLGTKMMIGARAEVGVRTGALRASIHMRQERWARGQLIMVGSSLGYAAMHHEGTRPHVITPRTGRHLRFVSRGQIVYATIVHHPGTRPNHFLSNQLRYVND